MKLSSRSNRGRALEKLVLLSQRGIVSVVKQDARAVWRGGKLMPLRGDVDFVGTVCGSGRMICFDAKECGLRGSFRLDHLASHQRDYLRSQGGAGAIAGVLIHATHTDLRMFFWLPWDSAVDLWPAPVPWESDALIEVGDGDVIDFRKVIVASV